MYESYIIMYHIFEENIRIMNLFSYLVQYDSCLILSFQNYYLLYEWLCSMSWNFQNRVDFHVLYVINL